jgi:hypothetical protein
MLRVGRILTMTCVLATAVAAPMTAAERTSIEIYSPWVSGTLARGFTVSARVKGSCGIHSLASERADAWRCSSDEDMYDPCFTGSVHKDTLACAQSPFSKHVTLLRLTKPLADMKLGGDLWGLRLRGAPWGVRLVEGGTCVEVQGATDVFKGERLNYPCTEAGWIFGTPDRSTAIWRAQTVDWPHHHVTTVRIATAIF